MKHALILILSLAALLLSACGGGADPGDAPPDSPPSLPDAEPDSEPEEAQEADGESSEEEETEIEEVVVVVAAPPAGRYSIEHHPGTTVCQGVVTLDIPGLPPEFMDLSPSEDNLTLVMHTNEGSISLGFVEEVLESGNISFHWEGVLTVAGLDIHYTAYWNEFGLEEINGRITSETTVNVGGTDYVCNTDRGYTATRVGP